MAHPVPRPRILVIKLGALGDFLMALGPMQAIRRQHPDAELVLLTREPYRQLGRSTGLFAQVWVDPAPRSNGPALPVPGADPGTPPRPPPGARSTQPCAPAHCPQH